MNRRLLLFTLALFAPTASWAADLMKPAEGAFACPPLMTDKECTDYAHTLAGLPPGNEREAFLLAHAQLMGEREKACSCAHYREALARAAPARYPEGARLRF